MLKTGPKSVLILLVIFTFCTCIDPYYPKLDGNESQLVVEGLLTDANTSNTIRLSKTFQDQNSTAVYVTDATISISDDNGNNYYLKNEDDGLYKSDSTEFRGIVGRTYILHVVTKEGEEYESDPCFMHSVPDLDSIYFAKDEKLVNNQTEKDKGISIYLDSKGGDIDQFYRWTYEETWNFKVPNPKIFNYIKTSDPNNPLILPVSVVKDICWKNRRSDEILIRSSSEELTGKIDKQPILFIASERSDRLLIQYSILVKQYSISKNEYEFWNNMKQVNEAGSDIFARQPYSVRSNIHNTKNPKERVLGYFQVSAVSQKRKNIPYRVFALMGLHFYQYQCKTWEFDPLDFETLCRCPPKTWDDVYWYLSIASDYTFIEPKYNNVADHYVKLVFTRPECADCELAGSLKKPDFWIDM